MDAISLTKRMDELFAVRDLVALKAMYHPDVESVKPNGEVVKGLEENFGTFERLIANQFPNITIESLNFVSDDHAGDAAQNLSSCTFDTVTNCNNEAIVVDGVTKLAANASYNIRKQNTFKDGLLFKTVMVGSANNDVVCKNGKV
mmetsp:Transcript_31010/g.60874  ORF Transcript_31010/g.60874 Transcript_31010/m.60874 type:complete len:145 (-) Transcript_31010:147-581(-)|eukprot:CAMPEP_0172683564 /NCGR_PEP_ID=MMETSP1074-20121228/18947_1 /TAXON_ID=2916 /ORGANISM="Ceratium fusus, Strain PA161109" /LENGTH=144 /DNA_ID=CAMNT_0013502431 /DNA_START=93 /DNA_END=527 /DNA_ORIENTATION=-